MRTFPRILLLCLLISTTAIADETLPQATSLTDHSRWVYGILHRIVAQAAENVPEEGYAFRPVESVRTFGQIVGHIADAQYGFCSGVRGEKNPAPLVEKNKSAKADLIAALHEAFAYCDAAYEGMTDASGTATVKLGPNEMPKLGLLMINQSHTMEHYGNLVTYMRMQGLVPPTSDPEFMKAVARK